MRRRTKGCERCVRCDHCRRHYCTRRLSVRCDFARRIPGELPAEALRHGHRAREPKQRSRTCGASASRSCAAGTSFRSSTCSSSRKLAEDEKILATPTLIKQLPPPLRRVIGDLSDTERCCSASSVPADAATDQTANPTSNDRAARTSAACRSSRPASRSFDIIAKGGLPREPHHAGLRHRRQRQDRVRDAVPRRGHRDAARRRLRHLRGVRRATSARTCAASAGTSPHGSARASSRSSTRRRTRTIEIIESGAFDLGALLARVENAVRKVERARACRSTRSARCSRSSPISRSSAASCSASPRRSRSMGVTAMLTAERTEDYGPIARFGVEEFIADNVMVLRNVLDDEKRRRTIEILKFRGTDHQKGEFPFTIVSDGGIVVIPLSAMELKQKSSNVRISSGNAELDADVRRRLLPRFGHPRLRRDGHGQDADGHAVPAAAARPRASDACCSRSRRAASSSSATRAAGAWTSRRMEREGLLQAWSATIPKSAALEDWLLDDQSDRSRSSSRTAWRWTACRRSSASGPRERFASS